MIDCVQGPEHGRPLCVLPNFGIGPDIRLYRPVVLKSSISNKITQGICKLAYLGLNRDRLRLVLFIPALRSGWPGILADFRPAVHQHASKRIPRRGPYSSYPGNSLRDGRLSGIVTADEEVNISEISNLPFPNAPKSTNLNRFKCDHSRESTIASHWVTAFHRGGANGG